MRVNLTNVIFEHTLYPVHLCQIIMFCCLIWEHDKSVVFTKKALTFGILSNN